MFQQARKYPPCQPIIFRTIKWAVYQKKVLTRQLMSNQHPKRYVAQNIKLGGSINTQILSEGIIDQSLSILLNGILGFNNNINDSMKKHSSTSQFMTVRERPTISTTVPPTFDSARFVKKRKLTDKFEPANNTTTVTVKEPLGSSTVMNVTTPIVHKNKTIEVNSKRAKENIPHINKKPSVSTIGPDRKQSVRIDVESKEKNPRLTKVPLRRDLENKGSTSSRLIDQPLFGLDRHSLHPTTELRTIVEILRTDSYQLSPEPQFVIQRETQQEKEQKARSIVQDIVNKMFDSSQFRISQVNKQNKLLIQELQKTKYSLQVLQRERQESMICVRSRITLQEDELSGLKATTQSNQCLIAELEYRLAQAQQQLQSQNSPELAQLQSTVHHLQTQLANQCSKVDLIERQSQTYKREIVTIKKQNAILRKENTHYRNVNEQNEIRINQYETTIQELRASAESAQRMAHSLQMQLLESQKQLKIPECEQVANLKDLVAESSSQVFRLNKEISNLEIKLAIIERRHMEELERIKGQHTKELRTWRERNKKLVRCNANLKQLVDERDDMSIDFSLNDDVV